MQKNLKQEKKLSKSTAKTSKNREPSRLTVPMLTSPVAKAISRTFGSILIALSGITVIFDKVFPIWQESQTFILGPLVEMLYNWSAEKQNFGFKSPTSFIWSFFQSLTPLVLIFAFFFKPYRISYLIPIYIFSIQLYWVFDPSYQMDNPLLHVYAIGAVIGFIGLVVIINVALHKARKEETGRRELTNLLLDLHLKNKDG
ncbi:MAG: hypothetical protein AAF717_00120 [Bacteroidota bacterium]